MSKQYKQKFCGTCDKTIRAERDGTNHILHLILSIITLGCWIPIWCLVSLKIGGWMCPTCGEKNKLRNKKETGPQLYWGHLKNENRNKNI